MWQCLSKQKCTCACLCLMLVTIMLLSLIIKKEKEIYLLKLSRKLEEPSRFQIAFFRQVIHGKCFFAKERTTTTTTTTTKMITIKIRGIKVISRVWKTIFILKIQCSTYLGFRKKFILLVAALSLCHCKTPSHIVFPTRG